MNIGPNGAENDAFFNRPRSAQQQYDAFGASGSANQRAGQKSDRRLVAKASFPSQQKSSFQKEGGFNSSYYGSGAGNFGFPNQFPSQTWDFVKPEQEFPFVQRYRGRSSEGLRSASRGSRTRSRDGSFDQMQQEIGLGFDPTKPMGRARSRPRDRSPAGPQSHRPDIDASRRWWPEQQHQPQPMMTKKPRSNVTHVPYIGPPSPRAGSRSGGSHGTSDPRQRGQTAADIAQKALNSVTGAFGNIMAVPENAFGQGSPSSAVQESQLIEAEMRQKQLLASQKQMQLNALMKEREQQRQQYGRGGQKRSRSRKRSNNRRQDTYDN